MVDVKHCIASPINDFEGFLHIFYRGRVKHDDINYQIKLHLSGLFNIYLFTIYMVYGKKVNIRKL
jgi:hypothetical protein